MLTISVAPELVPTETLYPVAFVAAFQLKSVVIATLVALFIGLESVVQLGAVGKVSVWNDSSVHPVASPKVLYGTIVTNMVVVSGKLVISGSFNSVQEVNKDEFLSVNFIPSNVNDLAKKIEQVIVDYDELTEKYKDVKKYACEKLTYTSVIHRLYKEY